MRTRRLFHDGAVEIEVEDAVTDRSRLGRQASVDQAEEEQNDDQDDTVLDPDKQLPAGADELHLQNLNQLAPLGSRDGQSLRVKRCFGALLPAMTFRWKRQGFRRRSGMARGSSSCARRWRSPGR